MSEQLMHPAQLPLPWELNAYTGGEQVPGGLVPPYEGRQTNGPIQEQRAKDPQKMGEGTVTGPRDISQVEREGVPSTVTTGRSPLGVGVSQGRQGNERMYSSSVKAREADRLDIGVGDRSKNIDPSSLTTPTDGDQGANNRLV
jgi:hypothetical protein